MSGTSNMLFDIVSYECRTRTSGARYVRVRTVRHPRTCAALTTGAFPHTPLDNFEQLHR